MTKINFEISGISIESDEDYTDEGFVKSISDKTMELYERYGYPTKGYDRSTDENVKGRYLHFTYAQKFHILYLDLGSEPLNIQNRAHEETHIIDLMNQLDILMERIYQLHRVRINFHEIEDRELRAQLGSLSALYANGYTPEDMPARYSQVNANWIEAQKIWNES